MNANQWNQFVAENSSPSSFLQSWQWGEFQSALGNRVCRVAIEDILQAQVIVKSLPLRRTYLEVPKGPIIDNSKFQWEEFIGKLREIGKREKAVLARINPPYDSSFQQAGNFQKPEILMRQTEPEETILADLFKTEDELMANMHEKSRYNIRLAQKKGVRVRQATADERAFESFLFLLHETALRDGITSWPPERFWTFRKMFMTENSVGKNMPCAELLVGELDGQILAAAIIMLFGDSATYLYAASSSENRPANAPSLVLWEAIRLAKRTGKRWYDMWGIAPAESGENHPWAGITRFKSRYIKLNQTGRLCKTVGARDLILDKKFYRLFKLAKKFRP